MIGAKVEEKLLRGITTDVTKVAAAKVAAKAEAQRLVYRHMAVLAPASIISHLTRAVRELTDLEIDQLHDACVACGTARRVHFPDMNMTPKEIMTEDTVNGLMAQVRYYRTLGWFGEDGIEALHPYDARKRQLVQAIRNPEARHRAHSRLLTADRYTDKLQRKVLSRPGGKRGEAAAVAAAATSSESLVAAESDGTEEE